LCVGEEMHHVVQFPLRVPVIESLTHDELNDKTKLKTI
jgi:hypothetical protein